MQTAYAAMSSSYDYDDYDYHEEEDMDVESDRYSIASGSSLRYAQSVSTSATSHDWEMRSASPAPSMYSVTSSLRAASYRHEYGRGINNYSEVYRLPADDEEYERLGAFLHLPVSAHTDARPRPSTHHVYGSHG